MGPLHPYSRHLHQTKYRDVDETFDHYVHRYSDALTDDKEGYDELSDAIGNQRILPAGRQQLAVGREFKTTAFNCFSGNTEIMTEFGFEKLADICGKERFVISPVSGDLEPAIGKSYGSQDLYEIEISKTFRGGGESYKVCATKNHRWVLQNGEVTQDLKIGDVLKCGSQYLESDGEGWIHGFVFGDGCKSKDKDRYTVRLCGKKRQYSHMFDRCADVVSVIDVEGDTLYRLRSKTNYKELPSESTISYIRGFVDGWIAADACTNEYFTEDGHKRPYQMHSINLEAMQWLYDYIVLSRYAPTGKISVHTEPSNYGERKPLYKFHFRDQHDHLGYKVVNIKYHSTEEVFCVEEPKYRQITLRNGLRTGQCFVGGDIEDSMGGIFDALKEGALTLRSGGGCGWNFGTLRPEGDLVRGLGVGASSSGPLSFMDLWNTMCGTIESAGHRRGAMMGVMPVSHPDIVEFVNAKRISFPGDEKKLARFNISVSVTDHFMECVRTDSLFDLTFGGRVYGDIRATDLWSMIMESNYNYAEPGILFIDRINDWNNLHYCETISATNPCAEQPLPPYGACLLGSLNIVKYVEPITFGYDGFNTDLLRNDAAIAVRAFDNVIDRTYYPLEKQKLEAQSKRRMGVGVTGIANALSIMGFDYGTPAYIEAQSNILRTIRDACYEESIRLAQVKGPFEKFDDRYLEGRFIATLPDHIREGIAKHGIRNSHLLSIAPTGTISICADNVSSGIEPPFAHEVNRKIIEPRGEVTVGLKDYAFHSHGIKGLTAHDVSPEDHIDVLCATQRYVDSSVSKTCNVSGLTFDEFKDLYMRAYVGGAKGCSTFNADGKREGIMEAAPEFVPEACFIDPETGVRTCE